MLGKPGQPTRDVRVAARQVDGLVQVLAQLDLQLLDGGHDQLVQPQVLQPRLARVEEDLGRLEALLVDEQLAAVGHDVLAGRRVVFGHVHARALVVVVRAELAQLFW